MKPADELLYDSEASLRLVDRAITELSESGTELDEESRAFLQHVMSQPGGFSELSKSLLRAYAETLGIVARMQDRPSSEPTDLERLRQVQGNLRDVRSTTELAASQILDGLGRAIALVERLDADGVDDEARHNLVAALREHLYEIVAHLQFQDITAQRLDSVSGLLGDTRRRLLSVLTTFAPQTAAKSDGDRFNKDSRASMLNTDERETVVVETLARKAARKSA